MDVLHSLCYSTKLRNSVNNMYRQLCDGDWIKDRIQLRNRSPCRRNVSSLAEAELSTSPNDEYCRQLDKAELCLHDDAFSREYCQAEYRDVVSNMWPVFLGGEKAARRKNCHARCPAGWSLSPDTESCVKMFVDTATWQEASEICGNNHAHLVQVNSPELESFLYDLFDGNPSSTSVWTGKSYRDNQMYTTTRPHNQFISITKNCTMITFSHLDQSNCDNRLGFICQTPSVDCWQISECVHRAFGFPSLGDHGLVEYFMSHGAASVPRICEDLSGCFGVHSNTRVCARDAFLYEAQGFVNVLCKNAGRHLISNAFEECSLREFNTLESTLEEMEKNITIEDTDGNQKVCWAINERLSEVKRLSLTQCQHYGSTFITLMFSQRYSQQYKHHNCLDLHNGCWPLRSCLDSFLQNSSLLETFQWTQMFQKLEGNRLVSFCR
ncbi:hypothetical protein ElyMa_002624400 [Elysia marginata]|uniref:C-type lectin domain-containing protein n=1 Tax=Elysia marginata TaxID=1093978 RepID=A0AAV4H431_9GAST|nr:hypothetical protein ElyMa_002624400 [Elysia marginata]